MKFISLFCLVFSSAILPAQQPAVIEYAAVSTFHWGLFKGKINPRHLAEMGKNTGAVTVSSISYSSINITDHSSTVIITARFHPQESWTRYPDLNQPEEALEHEKRHFDITEIYARKLRQLVSTTHFSASHFQDEVSRLFKDIVSQQRAEQGRYDHETKHSTDTAQQQKWNDRVDAQLEALSAYSATTVSIRFNR